MWQYGDEQHPYPCVIGGTSHLDNLQLLCGYCNSLKGNRPMDYLRARTVRGVCEVMLSSNRNHISNSFTAIVALVAMYFLSISSNKKTRIRTV